MNEEDQSPDVKNTGIVERDLSLAEEDVAFAEVSVEVPPEESGDGTYYKYTVRVPKAKMTESLMSGSFQDFWKEIENKVMEDIKRV